jgi:hypothetical protein
MCGEVVLKNVVLEACKKCNSQQLTQMQGIRLVELVKKHEQSILAEKSFFDFLKASEVSMLFGIDEEHFNSALKEKIERRVYWMYAGAGIQKEPMYLKESVVAFQQTGSGLIRLC